MPSLVKYENGIRVIDTERKTSLIADPTTIATAKKNTATIITHAHTDHAIAFPNEGIKVYATKIASELFSTLTGKKSKNTFFMEYNKEIKIKEMNIEALPAGHLLGAAQILFKTEKKNILYTGDISFGKMKTVKEAKEPEEKIDILITEATYGKPDLYFEPRETVKMKIFNWIVEKIKENNLAVINVGNLGPAQEIIAYLNEMLEIDIYCNKKTSRINEVYKKNGIKLKYKEIEEIEEKIDPKNSLILLSRGEKKIPEKIIKEKIKVKRAIVTGQAARFNYTSFEKAFPFSMHANTKEIEEYAKKIKPKKIYTLYGFESELAAYLRKKINVDARPLKIANEKLPIEEFF